MPKRNRLTDDELLSIIQAEIATAQTHAEGSPSEHRKRALDYYLGMPYGDEEDDRSKVVTSEVSDAVEGMMPQLIKMFCSTDDVVSYEPTQIEHEQFATLATEYGRHIFNVDNPGFTIFYTSFKDALLFRNCAAKVWWEEKTVTTTEHYAGLVADELVALEQQEGFEVVDKIERSVETPDGQSIVVCDVQVQRSRKEGRVRIVTIPPEELLIRPRMVDIEMATCIHHRVRKEISDLVEEGYDLEVLEELSGTDDNEFGTEKWDRFRSDGADNVMTGPDRARSVVIIETFIALDTNGDGAAERWKCVTSGGRWLEKNGKPAKEEWTGEWPIVGGTAMIMPHKWTGRSWADLTMDLQRMSSSLQRQMMDNIYAINNNRIGVVEGRVNLDDLLLNRQQQIVRFKDKDAYLGPLTVPPIINQLMPYAEMLQAMGEQRHAVTRYNQGLDADSLNQTKGGMQMIMTASQERVLLAARCLAETFVKPLFKRILQLICQHQREPRMIKLSRGWVKMNPREWSDQMAVTTRVGLGTGNKDEMRQNLGMLAQYQTLAMQAGAPICTWDNVYHLLTKITENAGWRDVESFWTDPKTVQPQPPADPTQDPQFMGAAIGAKAQIGVAQIRAQQQTESDQTKAQIDHASAVTAAELEARKLMQQQQIADADRQSHERIAMAQMELELHRLQQDHTMRSREMEAKAAEPVNGGGSRTRRASDGPDHMSTMLDLMRQHLQDMSKVAAMDRVAIRGSDGRISGLRLKPTEGQSN